MSRSVLSVVDLSVRRTTVSPSVLSSPITFDVSTEQCIALLSAKRSRDGRPDRSPSDALRRIARLEVEEESETPSRVHLIENSRSLSDLATTDWRAAIAYIPLDGEPPSVATDQVSLKETVVEVSNYCSQRKRGRTPDIALQAMNGALTELGLDGALADCPWSKLERKLELPCAILALALSVDPAVLLLDGVPRSEAALRIETVLSQIRKPYVWACDEETARRLDVRIVLIESGKGDCLGMRDSRASGDKARSSRVEYSLRTCGDDDKSPVPQSKGTVEAVTSVILWVAVAASFAVTPVRGAVLEFASASRHLVRDAVQKLDLTGPTPVSVGQLIVCSVLVFMVAGVSWWKDIGLEARYFTAAIRCAIQLSLLGIILVPIFRNNIWWQVIGYMLLMMLVAAQDCASRPPYRFRTKIPMYFWILASFGSATVVLISFVLFVVLRVGLRALEAIPIGGMVMQSCLSSTAVALSNSLTTLAERKESIEMLLALGATRFEASRALVRQSVILGMTPVISLMATTGIVSLSGMMTGQMLGGVDPTTAARYQIIIMYLLSCSTFMCTMSSSILTVIAVMDDEHRVRSDRLEKQRGSSFSMQSIRDTFSARSRLFAWFRYQPIQENGAVRDQGAAQVASYGAISDIRGLKETPQASDNCREASK